MPQEESATMSARDPAVDAYRATLAPFAQEVMDHLRRLIHQTCPDIAETIKWQFPHFSYRGAYLCIFAGHAQHCSLTFWKQEIMSDPRLAANPDLPARERYLGRITGLADLPPDAELMAHLREAMVLNETGAALPVRAPRNPGMPEMPPAFAGALAGHPAAQAVWAGKSDAFRKEYLIWITDAKTDATRDKRIAEALGWITEGKGRFWKYAR
jgi:hypothetical protein